MKKNNLCINCKYIYPIDTTITKFDCRRKLEMKEKCNSFVSCVSKNIGNIYVQDVNYVPKNRYVK